METHRPEYWKAAVLEQFNGTRWLRSRRTTGETLELPTQVEGGPAGATLRQRHTGWITTVGVTIGPMQSRFVLGTGEAISVDGVDHAESAPDGSTIAGDGPLGQGDSYSEIAYVPNPDARQLRTAPRRYPSILTRYTELGLPGRTKEVGTLPSTPVRHPEVRVPLRGGPTRGEGAARAAITASPYGSTWRLAHRITAGDSTAYAAAQSIQRYLRSHMTYNEDAPRRHYPLRAFLFRDKIGYCQQYAGSMALMLRMLGIPTRVVSGFSPGSPDPKNPNRYIVEDLDAHSWVEVYFPTIGWVTFDPTPPAAPAAGRNPSTKTAKPLAAGPSLNSTDPGGSRRKGFTPARNPNTTASVSGGSFPLWIFPSGFGALAAIALAGGAALVIARRLRYARLSPEARLDAHLRELRPALARLNEPIGPDATLFSLEQRFLDRGKRTAARYVAKLRVGRFAAANRRPMTLAERRELRADLAARTGVRGRLRAYFSLPPGAPG